MRRVHPTWQVHAGMWHRRELRRRAGQHDRTDGCRSRRPVQHRQAAAGPRCQPQCDEQRREIRHELRCSGVRIPLSILILIYYCVRIPLSILILIYSVGSSLWPTDRPSSPSQHCGSKWTTQPWLPAPNEPQSCSPSPCCRQSLLPSALSSTKPTDPFPPHYAHSRTTLISRSHAQAMESAW